jgi:invasion protein IalB
MMRRASVLEGAGRLVRIGSAMCGVLILATAVGLTPGAAQQKQAPPAKKSEPAAKGKEEAKGDQPQSAWVKLCEKAPLMARDKDGKEVKQEKNVCLTHHERLDGNTGMVMVSAAIRQVEGAEKAHLMIMVPLGMAIHPGVRATIYTKELWDQAQKNQKVEDAKSEPIKLSYALCHPAGCTAEIEADKPVIDRMKVGGGVMILAVNAQGQVIAFPVPLTGFTQAFDGQPVDNQKYSEARKALMVQISERQKQMMEEYRKQQEQQAATGSTGGQQTPSAAPAAKAQKK